MRNIHKAIGSDVLRQQACHVWVFRGQYALSLACEILASRMMPQVRICPGSALAKYRLANGMRIRTTYPYDVRFPHVSHTVSKE